MPKTPRGKDRLDSRVRKSETRLDYEDLIRQVTKVVETWGPTSRFDPGWTTAEWQKEFLDVFTKEGWGALERRKQDSVLSFLEDGHTSNDFYSSRFVRALLP
jgi:hypothetical protein